MLVIRNLNLMVTQNCNFKCAHCLRGESAEKDISDKVLRKVFKKRTVIMGLQLNGGEVFVDPSILYRVINQIMTNHVVVSNVVIVTNGTLYTEKIESMLDTLNNYITLCNKASGIAGDNFIRLELSTDEFHTAELKKVAAINPGLYLTYCENINRLRNSKYFGENRVLHNIINSGRAKKLPGNKVDKVRNKMFYIEEGTIYGKVFEVGTLGIDIGGNVCQTCGEMPPEIVYGNVTKEDVEDIVRRYGIRCQNEMDLYNKDMETLLENSIKISEAPTSPKM